MNIRAVLVLLTWVLCCFCMPMSEIVGKAEDMPKVGTAGGGKATNGYMPNSKGNAEGSEDISDNAEDISDNAFSSAEETIKDTMNQTEVSYNNWFSKFDSALARQVSGLTQEIKLYVRAVVEKLNELSSEVGVLLKHVSRSALELAKIMEDFRGYIKEWDSLLFERVSNATQIFLDNVENSIFGLLSDIRRHLEQWSRIVERTLNDIEERLFKVFDLLIELLTRLIDVHLDDMFESLGSILRSLSILLVVSIGISVAIHALLLLFICAKCIDLYSKCTSLNEVKKVNDWAGFTARSSKSLGKLETKGAPINTKMERDVEFTKMAGTTLQMEKTSSESYEDPIEGNRGSSKARKTKSGEKVHLRKSRDVEFLEMDAATLQVEKTSSVSYEHTIQEIGGSSTANKTKYGEKVHLTKSGDVEFIAMDEMTLHLEKTVSLSRKQGTHREVDSGG